MVDKKIRNNTIIFAVVTGLANVILTLAIMFVLFIVSAFMIYKVFKCQTALPIQIAMPVVLIGGLIIDFFLSIKIIRFFIIKLNLKDKINPKIAAQYLYDKKHPDPNDPRYR
jgi:hypothetical protein